MECFDFIKKVDLLYNDVYVTRRRSALKYLRDFINEKGKEDIELEGEYEVIDSDTKKDIENESYDKGYEDGFTLGCEQGRAEGYNEGKQNSE